MALFTVNGRAFGRRLYILFTFGDYFIALAMHQFTLIPVFALFLMLSADAVAAEAPLEFHGEVNRAETLIHRFAHKGTAYEFRLVPAGGGWTIWIGTRENRDHNFVAVATPPFRGINPATIEGWHFRNSANSGPNVPGAGNVNAPQKERGFFFVLDEASYQEAQEALEILLWPDGRSEPELKNAESRLALVPRGEGTLWVDALELGSLSPGERAHIERMAFRVRLRLP